ncbi:hypothetical protein SAMN05421772_10738 [Paracoccus saliphilus]|uniref:Uncharacterized protein n=1 Tax=Paracoccus saliphilus TaxID=405559 RepID=A0AA45W4N9_9RHOB|nr:hypothetical protein SAMN05421772_10738 [Paracoccus saliphilus]
MPLAALPRGFVVQSAARLSGFAPTASSSSKYPGGPGAAPPAIAGRNEPGVSIQRDTL